MKKYLFAFVLLLCSACGNEKDMFQGYVEGEYLYLSSSRSGRLEKLHVEKGEQIQKNTLIFELENASEKHALMQAKGEMQSALAQLNDMKVGKRPEEIAMATAMLNQARAEAKNANVLLKRNEELAAKGAISKQDLDTLRAHAKASNEKVSELQHQVEVYRLSHREQQIESQNAHYEAAKAIVAQREWDLAQKQLFSPSDGLVYDTLYNEGEWVQAGSPVVWLLLQDEIKVRFYIPEELFSTVQYGQNVFVHVDGGIDGTGKEYSATINYIAPHAEYTPPVIYSNETRSKLVYMVEAVPQELLVRKLLHAGQPVSVSLSE